jgi:hypothetical protein
MSDPRKWRDSENESSDIQRMFAAGRATRGLPSTTNARLARRLGAKLAVPAAASWFFTWKGIALAATLSATAATGVAAVAIHVHRHAVSETNTVHATAPTKPVNHAMSVAPSNPQLAANVDNLAVSAIDSSSSSNPTTTTTTTTTAAASPTATATPHVEHEARVAMAPIARPIATSVTKENIASELAINAAPTEPVAPRDTLSRELSLLQDARAHLDSDPRATLALLADHERAFPGGKLTIERELIALDALRRLGRTADERARAEHLRSTVHGTIYEERVETHLRDQSTP